MKLYLVSIQLPYIIWPHIAFTPLAPPLPQSWLLCFHHRTLLIIERYPLIEAEIDKLLENLWKSNTRQIFSSSSISSPKSQKHIVQLMGVIHTEDLSTIHLVFEGTTNGSLYNFLHVAVCSVEPWKTIRFWKIVTCVHSLKTCNSSNKLLIVFVIIGPNTRNHWNCG